MGKRLAITWSHLGKWVIDSSTLPPPFRTESSWALQLPLFLIS